MGCKRCGKSEENVIGLCNGCSQQVPILDKYPGLSAICSIETIKWLKTNPSISDVNKAEVICQKCRKSKFIKLDSLISIYQKNFLLKSTNHYYCHKCSKSGKLGVDVETVMPLIDVDMTISMFGAISPNVKHSTVAIHCEDCYELQKVKLGNVLHQARRHRQNNRACIYKCFKCGIKRSDSLEKQIESRVRQLTKGKRSSLEIATSNRLKYLNIKFVEQFPIGMYLWDFFLPDHNLLIDVNGEYWHGLPKNLAKDKSKLTYTHRYHPEYKCLIIEERYFLNPLMVDKMILSTIGILPDPIQKEFSFDDVVLRTLDKSDKSYVNFLGSYHYAQSGRSGKVVYGAYISDELIAICKFNSVIRREVASSMERKTNEVMELDRFCIHPSFHKKNFASWFLSRCSKKLFNDFPLVLELVSFADPTFGHSGTIYRAANWLFLHDTKPSYHYMNELGIPINKKRVYDLSSKQKMKEADYVLKYNLIKFIEKPKKKYLLSRS